MIKLSRSVGLKQKVLLVGFLFINLAVLPFYLFREEMTLSESLQSSKDKLSYSLKEILEGYGSGYYKKGKISSRNRKVLLPASFDFDRDALNHHLHSTSAKHWRVEQIKPSERIEVPPISNGKFTKSEETKIYNSIKEVPKDQCYSGLGEKFSVFIDQIDIVPGDIKNFLEIYLEELDSYNDEYNEDIAPILADHARVELKKDIIAPYWFRLSGSSVWLKEYNVHMVISRLIFSHRKSKSKSDTSLVLAQIFDKDWNELKDVRLVFPTNKIDSADSPTFHSDGQDFYSFRFPRVMPVPFFHEYKKKGMNFVGPEDPRAFLVQNARGYEEPMIIFNAYQYRYWKNEKGEMESKRSRNMFMSFLFQLQKGKNDIEPNEKADHKYFCRTKELIIAGEGRTATEKNWTPIVSENQEYPGADRYVYFATQLSNLKIIKCDLYSDRDECEVDFDAATSVGPLRGGSPFVNINQLLRKQSKYHIRRLIPEGREIWIAVARAHLKNCGCSGHFYRPNLVVLTKDEASYFDEETNKFIKKHFWKISHVSSFFGMGAEVVAWHPEDPESICKDQNVLIPNGIGTWSIRELEHSHGKWYVDDVMTLFFSIADFTVDKVNIKGVLHAFMNTRDNSLFMNVPSAPANKNLNQPVLNSNGELEKELPGFTDTNIDCALEESVHFCKAYGVEQRRKQNVFGALEIAQAVTHIEDKLSEMTEPLKEVGY